MTVYSRFIPAACDGQDVDAGEEAASLLLPDWLVRQPLPYDILEDPLLARLPKLRTWMGRANWLIFLVTGRAGSAVTAPRCNRRLDFNTATPSQPQHHRQGRLSNMVWHHSANRWSGGSTRQRRAISTLLHSTTVAVAHWRRRRPALRPPSLTIVWLGPEMPRGLLCPLSYILVASMASQPPGLPGRLTTVGLRQPHHPASLSVRHQVVLLLVYELQAGRLPNLLFRLQVHLRLPQMILQHALCCLSGLLLREFSFNDELDVYYLLIYQLYLYLDACVTEIALS